MRPFGLLAALLPALTAIPAQAAANPPMIVINVLPGGQPHLPARIKAIDLDTRVALSFDTALVLNTPAAERAGLKSFPLIGKGKFENAMIPGGEARFRWNLFGVTPAGAAKGTVPVVWVDKAVAADADGVLPASVIKADRIIFDLGPQAPAAKVRTILRKSGGSVLMKTRIGDETINVALELNSPDTVMNARAAAALAGAGLVKRAGDVGFWRPFPGVSLPFERMVPTAGAAILGLPLVRPAVRITEAQAREIDSRARAGTSTASDDDDAITVTASRKRGRDPWILIGRDVLNQCSRIVFDRPGKAWVLTCAF